MSIGRIGRVLSTGIKRITAVFAISLTLCVVELGGAASPAFAGTTSESCSPNHCYSIAQFNGLLTGVWGEWLDENMNPGSSSASAPFHITSENWFLLNNGSYIETGLANGYQFTTNTTGSCSCVTYGFFWADTNPNGVQWVHYGNDITPDLNNHTYEIQRAGTTNDWNIFLDYNLVGLSTATQTWNGTAQQVGGELYATAVNNPAGSFANTFNQYVQGENSSGSWYYYGQPSTTQVSAGFNGTSAYGNSQWAWNEPQ